MVKITFRDQEWEVEAGITVREAIEKVGLTPEMVLPVRDGKLITEDTRLEEGDEIKLVAVISGGGPS
ncbi:MAG: thiamine biosynthesis protein ThiS [Chloroflexi bacterium]|nr:MAG: thiamine biosynthesis protein ThiS [Chloroflexota bacterium]